MLLRSFLIWSNLVPFPMLIRWLASAWWSVSDSTLAEIGPRVTLAPFLMNTQP
jgi:hypothetical protein